MLPLAAVTIWPAGVVGGASSGKGLGKGAVI
jgi:ribosome-binding ATPase YchF (GTP1/OBG family)